MNGIIKETLEGHYSTQSGKLCNLCFLPGF